MFNGIKTLAVWDCDELQPGYAMVATVTFQTEIGRSLSVWIPEQLVVDYNLETYIGLVTETIRREVRDMLKNGLLTGRVKGGRSVSKKEGEDFDFWGYKNA